LVLLLASSRSKMTRMYGPAVRCKSVRRDSGERSCINVSGLYWSVLCSWPSWISARVRSH